MERFPRWLKVALLIGVLVALAGGAWFYLVQERQHRRQVENELVATARLKADQIADWRRERLDEGAELMERRFLTERISRWRLNPQSGDHDALLAEFRILQRYNDYSDVLLVDPDGRIRLSLSGAAGACPDLVLAALAAAWRDRRPVFIELHVDAVDAAPHTGVAAPLFSGNSETAGPLGALILISDARQFLYPLIQAWPVPSGTAETLLVRRDGEEVLFLNDLRHQPDTALRLRIPFSRTDVPAVMAVLGRQGVVAGRDYRGIEVLSALLPVPDSPWYMVAKIDAAEAFSALRRESAFILALLLSLAVLAGISVFVVWQRNQKAHYRTLYRSEARHGITLNSIGDAVIATDAEGNIEHINPVAVALTGWREFEALGNPLPDVFRIINEASRRPVENPVAKVLREGAIVGLANHTLLIAKDGKETPIADSGAPIRDENGEIAGVVLVFRDQTEERANQKAVSENEKKYRSLFNGIRDAILLADTDRNIIDCNPAFIDLFGYLPEEIKGRKTRIVYENEQEFSRLGEALQTHSSDPGFLYNVHYKKKDGSVFPGETKVFYLRDDAGLVSGFIGVIRDLTDRVRAEAERQKLQEQLQQAQKLESVGRLAGGVAHDFNNLLSIILGYGELMMTDLQAGHPHHEPLNEIYQAAVRAKNLTRQLLAFSRKQVLEMQPLDANNVVIGFEKFLRRIIGEDIELKLALSSAPLRISADTAQLEQVLMNLAVNARDAMTDGGVLTVKTIAVELDEAYSAGKPGVTPGMYACISVSDTGTGMDKETQEHLFEPFFTTKAKDKGTGLGLATSYGIVKQHGGNIWVYSEPGEGTTFKIYLPLGSETTAAASPAAPGPRRELPTGAATVLVVEDDQSLRKLAVGILGQSGYKVLESGSAANAVEQAKAHAGLIHLVLTDVVMPEMKGPEVYDRIRTHHPEARVLYMSGYADNVIIHHGVLEEGIAFIQKPFTVNGLLEKVAEVLGEG